jgi:hypothetical protein
MRYLSNFLTITALLAAQNVVTKIGWSDLPVAVQSAAKKQKTPRDAKVAYVKLVRAGVPYFEMKVDAGDGRDQEILFRSDGSIAETEEAVPIASVPAPVRAAIQQAARNGKLLKVDRILRDGKTFYEGEFMENGVKKKPIFNSAGEKVE